MPDEFGLLAEIMLNGVPRVVVAVTAGEDDDANFHGVLSV